MGPEVEAKVDGVGFNILEYRDKSIRPIQAIPDFTILGLALIQNFPPADGADFDTKFHGVNDTLRLT